MKLPREAAVMTLPNATLFPQALLPLYVFETRYRRMLADALAADRVFCVAMQRPNCTREAPEAVAGLGLIRVSVRRPDGTSHLILQGVARVELEETVRYRPYRVHRIRPLSPRPCNDVTVDALVCRVRELMAERIELGLPCPFPMVSPCQNVPASKAAPMAFAAREILKYVGDLKNPEHVADLVSCAVLRQAEERQTILATVDLETRLRYLIRFLLADIRQRRKESKT